MEPTTVPLPPPSDAAAALLTAAALVGGAGLLLLVAGLIMVVAAAGHGHRLRRTGALVLTPCAGVAGAGGRRSGPVAVRGRIGPGPAGLVTAPLSGEPCVWWHVRVDRIAWGETDAERQGRVDRHLAGPFAVTDATGAVLVDGRVAEDPGGAGGPLLRVTRGGGGPVVLDGHRLVALGLVDARFGRTGRGSWLEARETILPAGAEATVVGHPSARAGTVVLVRRPRRLAFARPEPLDDVVAATRRDRDAGRTAVALLLSLGGGLTAVGALLVLVAGLLR